MWNADETAFKSKWDITFHWSNVCGVQFETRLALKIWKNVFFTKWMPYIYVYTYIYIYLCVCVSVYVYHNYCFFDSDSELPWNMSHTIINV